MKTKLLKKLFLFCFFSVLFGLANAQAQTTIETLTLSVKNNPKNPAAWYKRGMAYFKLNKYQQAISDYNKSLELDPDDMKTVRSRGIAYYKLGDNDSALIDFAAVLDDSAYDKGILQMRGDLYRTQRKFRESAGDYSDFLTIDSTKDAIWFARGVDYYKLGRYDSAIYDFSKAIAVQHNNPEYTIRLILAYTAADDYNQAALLYTSYQQKKLAGYIDKSEYLFLKNYLSVCTKYLPNKNYTDALPLLLDCKRIYTPTADSADKADSIEYANILVKIGVAYQALDSMNVALDYFTNAKRISTGVEDVNTKMVFARDVIRINTTPPVIILDSPAHMSRGQYVTARISKKNKIYVRGTAKAPAGISSIKINGETVETDSTGVFEEYVSDTTSALRIQAWTKRNLGADTTFEFERTASIIPAITNKENYYAIFIANSNYNATPKWQPLETTVREANELKGLLVGEYSFSPENIDTLYNLPKRELLHRLDSRLKTLTENDNLLIYYGGHGAKDDQTGTAFWIPIDATEEVDYIKNQDLDELINKTGAKHVLIMADACYSSLMRDQAYDDKALPNAEQLNRYSRQLLTSGNAEPVPGVSVFIPTIIQTLKANSTQYLDALDLLFRIYDGVKNASHKQPILQPLNVQKSLGGQFFFRRKNMDGIDSALQAQKLIDRQKDITERSNRRDSLIKAGLEYKKNFDADAAVKMFQEAVSINPEESNTYAQHLLDEETKLHNMSPAQRFRSYADSAAMHEYKREHQVAIDGYTKLMNANPDKRDSLNNIINLISEKVEFINGIKNQFSFGGSYKDALRKCDAMIKKYRNDPEYYYWRALCYVKMGNHFTEAEDDFNSAITKQRSFKEAVKALADMYRDINKKKEAMEKYRLYVTIEKDPGIFMELYKLDVDPQVNHLDEAVEDLSSAITVDPTYKDAYFNRGLRYYQDKADYKKAFIDFDKAVQFDSLDAQAHFYRGNCYLMLNNLVAAATDYSIARNNKLSNDNIETIKYFSDSIYGRISKKFESDKAYDSAVTAINRAILIDPATPVYWFEKGNYYFEAGKFNNAINSYDSAVYLKVDYKGALYQRGVAYYNLAKYNDAIANFNNVLKLNPSEVKAIKYSADAFYQLKNYDSAVTVYNRALKVISDSKSNDTTNEVKSVINNNLGYAYYAVKMYDASITALKNAIKLNPNNAEAFYNISKSYEASGNLSDAGGNIDKAVGFAGYSSNYIWNYSGGNIYRVKADASKNKGEYARAVEYYTNAISNDSSKQLKTACYCRGYCNYKNNNFENAAKDYLAAINWNVDTGKSFYNELGKIYMNLPGKDSAYLFFNRSFSRDSSNENVAAVYGMASALFALNRVDESIPLFERAFKAKYPKSDIKNDPYYDRYRANKAWQKLYKDNY